MKLIRIIFLLFLPISIFSQEVLEIKGNIVEIGIFTEVQNDGLSNIEGTPYLNNEFVPAKINDFKKTQLIRINSLNQIFEVKTTHDKTIMLDLKYDYKIQLLDGSNRIYHSAYYFNASSKIKSFFEVLKKTNQYVLYQQEQKKYVKAQEEGSYQKKLPARIVDQEPRYFISDFKDKSENIIELPHKRKAFLRFFKNHKQKIDMYLKKNKLNHKKASDLIAFIDFILSETH